MGSDVKWALPKNDDDLKRFLCEKIGKFLNTHREIPIIYMSKIDYLRLLNSQGSIEDVSKKIQELVNAHAQVWGYKVITSEDFQSGQVTLTEGIK